MTQEEREQLIEDMVGCGRAWEEDYSRPDFPISVIQRLATLTPEEYESLWAEFHERERADMEAWINSGVEDDQTEDVEEGPGPVFHYAFQGDPQTEEARRLAAEFVENARRGVGTLQPYPVSMRPYVALTPETEAILGRLLNPTTTLERLCVAAMRGDAVALDALEDGIKQGELNL
jgi:hypothetical protein